MLGPDRGAVYCLGISIGRAAVGLWAENTRLPGIVVDTDKQIRVIRWRIFPRRRITSLFVVLRLLVFSFASSALVFPGIAHADDAENERLFAAFVREGDRTRLVGRTPEAVAAYEKALSLRQEPRIVGLLGVAYLDGGKPVQAAGFLLRALIDISGVPVGERRLIEDAFTRARSVVSRVKVDVSHIGADVTIDGKPEPRGTTANTFYFFTTPGHHELHATLAGYEDAVVSIDVQKGATVLVPLVLKAIPLPPTSPTPPPGHAAPTCAPCKTPEPVKPIAPVKRVESPWSVGAGVVGLSGAISYVPAMGVMVGGERRFGEWFSIRLDARAAWSPKYDTTWTPVRGVTFGGSLGACGNRSIYFGCLMMHGAGIGHSLETQNNPEIVWRARFGGGPTIGVLIPFYRAFSVRAGAELVILEDGTQVLAGSDEYPKEVWSGPQVLGGFSLTLVWRHELWVLR